MLPWPSVATCQKGVEEARKRGRKGKRGGGGARERGERERQRGNFTITGKARRIAIFLIHLLYS